MAKQRTPRTIVKEIDGGLMQILEKLGKERFPDLRNINIAKKRYLIENKDEILKALEMGYGYPIIAEAATEDLLKTGIQKTFSFTNKEGIEETRETKFGPGEIKNFIEPVVETEK